MYGIFLIFSLKLLSEAISRCHIIYFFIRRALSKELSKEECFAIALDELNYRRLTYHGAIAKYRIPRSTLSDHVLGKVELSKKPGPHPVLTPEEEKYLVQWTIDTYEVGYGQTQRQVTEMVKKSWIKMADQILLKIMDQK